MTLVELLNFLAAPVRVITTTQFALSSCRVHHLNQ